VKLKQLTIYCMWATGRALHELDLHEVELRAIELFVVIG